MNSQLSTQVPSIPGPCPSPFPAAHLPVLLSAALDYRALLSVPRCLTPLCMLTLPLNTFIAFTALRRHLSFKTQLNLPSVGVRACFSPEVPSRRELTIHHTHTYVVPNTYSLT